VILVDAGPLVAMLSATDQHRSRCVQAFRGLREPLATVWPAVAEAMHLLEPRPHAQDALLERVESESLRLLALGREDLPRVRELMRKYRDLPMDLADAALVRVAERENIETIFTIDRRDFQVYRPLGRRRFKIIP
jgi:predicted nucleic acid-binding protein